MNKIGVFYGSTTGTTEDLARRIAEKLDVPSADVFDVSKLTEALVNEYDVLVLGSSTWGAGELQDDWYDGVKVLKKWHKSKISDLSHYQNFYEFPKFRIKLLILILLHFNIVRIIY